MRGFSGKVKSAGLALFAHDDTHDHDSQMTGCGANDKLQAIVAKMQEFPDKINAARGLLGYGKSGEVDIKNLESCTTGQTPQERLNIVREEFSDDAVADLEGNHGELVIVWNLREGTTLDREALAAEFDNAEIFNVDAWAFEHSARTTLEAMHGAKFNPETGEKISEPTWRVDENMVKKYVDFLIDYNLATGLVLANGRMKLVARK
jgi:hypothetical protein